jgi:ABC-2 type transport system ATP-binding protein/lipopolysaccharide transport system ATP-binding protein
VGAAISRGRGGSPTITALDEVSLALADGDRVGVIGGNGAGKSTLLRVLGGVYEPCRGSVHVSGRVLSLSEPLLGMSHDCTGRENVVLRGIYLGLTPRQVKGRIDEIAEFSELGDYMDLPLRAYSVGMQLRLAFSIATAFDPDILLLDEQFLTGDAAFQEKAEKRLKAFVAKAGIVVQASHSERLIRDTCTRIALLDRGRLVMFGDPDSVFCHYSELRSAEAPVAA